MTEIELGQFYPVKTDTLPETWTVAYVGDFALTVQSGFACGKHGRENGVPHLRPMNVSRDGALDLSDVKTVPPEFNEKRLRHGDVLFNNTNSPELVGKTAFVTERGNGLAFSNHMTQVQVAKGVSSEFMALQLHHLWSQKYFFHRCVKHVNQASISATELATRIPFICPPSNEQRRIVEKTEAMFDEIDKGVESLQTARANLGLYRQSLLKSAFEGRLTADWRAQNADKLEAPKTLLTRIQKERDTRYKAALDTWQDALAEWRAGGEKDKKPTKPKRLPALAATAAPFSIPEKWIAISVGSLGRVETGATPPTKSKDNFGGNVPFFKPTDLEAGADVREAREFLSETGAEKSRPFSAGTILVTCIGATIGKTGLAGVDAACNQQINYIEPDPNFAPRFIYYQIISPFFQDQIKDNASSTTLPILNKGKFSQLRAIICSPAEQTEIVRIVDSRLEAADALEAEIDAALTRADALRQSILKKAFSGQLVPQDPNDEPAPTLLARIKADRAKAPKAKKRKTAHA